MSTTTEQSTTTDAKEYSIGKMYRCTDLPETDQVLVCCKRGPPGMKGRMVENPDDPSLPPTIELVLVPNPHFVMVTMKESTPILTSRLTAECIEIPESEQDPEAAAKVVTRFENMFKLIEVKEKLDRLKSARQRMVDMLAELQASLNNCLPEVTDMNKKITTLEEEIKELKELCGLDN